MQKLAIMREYADAYSKILSKQSWATHLYVDAFCDQGWHYSREDGTVVPGSPLNALRLNCPFDEYHFIDISARKAEALRRRVSRRRDVYVYAEDCNPLLLREIIPRIRQDSHIRALMVLDPYGLQVQWPVVRAAGQSKRVDLFLNFSTMGIHRGVLRKAGELITEESAALMTSVWGDATWRQVAYPIVDMFGNPRKGDPQALVDAYQMRLKDVAGFQYVPDPLPMRNSKGSIMYYLFFAAPNATAKKIVEYIFAKYRDQGAR